MTVTVYNSTPQLAEPRRFARNAAADLRAAPRIAWRLVAAQLRSRTRRAALGYLWFLIPPAAATFLCVYLQSSRILVPAPTPLPYPLHVLAGVLLWQIFVEALNAPVQQLLAARQ